MLDEHRCKRPQEAKDARHRYQGLVIPEEAHSEKDSSEAAAAVPTELCSPPPSGTLVPSIMSSTKCSPYYNLDRIPEQDEDPDHRRFATAPSRNEETISSFNIWWRFEAFILRLEYRRWKYWCRDGLVPGFARLYLFRDSFLTPSQAQSPFWIAISSCVTILYVICFFPFIHWVRMRYGDVLATDPSKADPLSPRRRRAIRMLGSLPNQCGDVDLMIECQRIRESIGTTNGRRRRTVLYGFSLRGLHFQLAIWREKRTGKLEMDHQNAYISP